MSRLYRDLAGPCLAPGGSVLCVGAFDGVHLGHRALLTRVSERAHELGSTSAAISFEPVPRAWFARNKPLPRLTGVRERIGLLADIGIERLLLLRFDATLAAMSAETFVERVIVGRTRAREIWVGRDFRFGHARRGDVALLRELGGQGGFRVEVLPDVRVEGARVSSSVIRAHLAAGEFDAAARLLGRRFAIGGHVARGSRLGRRLGYPTANIPLGRRVAPVAGIFAVRVHGIGDAPRPGVASLGVRPTIAPEATGSDTTPYAGPMLEAHLFDFDGDLYGRRIEVEFVAKLRDEEKFADLPVLVRQMDRDALAARRLLGVKTSGTADNRRLAQ
ncbi:MAG TPA: bifunctional riboflavin kinase/FAD synthetase [Rhodanobacteraceae bacterium]|nr:bifunctional riboflavin kinase/FAD synthetase [Rhodanobacteraceae bacterium]